MSNKQIYFFLFLIFTSFQTVQSQKNKKTEKQPLDSISLDGLAWRNIGPALTSGRISDIAVNETNAFEYYVATSAGGVWKTVNAGVSYEPIFDSQGSYSIGCVTIDPNNPNVIWVGSGENNNQRSVNYGDGVYKSDDAGKSWTNMGLKTSEHIGKIIVHPTNSDIVYVASLGPLWSKGGERGLYKTIDGGKNWQAVLTIDEHTGVNDVIMDFKNPEVLYASALQRRRHVYTYVGGGPGSSMYKSVDGGTTWNKINKGLPSTELGRIGLSMSPANSEIIYAIVESAEGKGGFYRSINRGASWEKRGPHTTSGNYYQEIISDPIDENTVYSMDTWMSVSKDGGKTFQLVGEDFKHVDNHSMWINPKNNKHWLVGSDGGIYETFDAAKTWDFKENLPVTQFYKVAVDNALPFYNIYGGTQDNFSLGGPSRVITDHGITNQDWIITHGGDGFESQVDPKNSNIVYAQSQYGVLVRYDKLSGEEVGIQPKERKDENAYRWNWDAPLAVSNHASGRLYFAANKLFRSNDYGNSWEVISEDLSRQIDRNTLKVFDRVLGIDAVMKNESTSPYGAIVALSESKIDENLIAVGTDDGLIHITENSGTSWRKIDNIIGAPQQSYVNSVYLSKHDVNVIYVAFNHHKYGDFKPYIFKSVDKGKTWFSISNNLPERGSIYTIEEDHIDKNLIFCGTEFSAFFSPNGGKNWKKLASGLPTILVRDMAIQERENDLVIGTFGRGFFVLDDYSSLRTIENKIPSKKAEIYPIRDVLMWEKSVPLGLPGKSFQGDNFYSAPNLGPEALITFYYNDKYESIEEIRKKKDKALNKLNKDTPYPSYSELKAETNEIAPLLVFTIKNDKGMVVKKITQKPTFGLQRFNWNLRFEEQTPVNLSESSFYNPFAGKKEGSLVLPGVYTIELDLFKDGLMKQLVAPVEFKVKSLNNTVMPSDDRAKKVTFQRDVAALNAEIENSQSMISEMRNKVKYIKEAIKIAELPLADLYNKVLKLEADIKDVNTLLYGDSVKNKLDIDQKPSVTNRIGSVLYEQKYSTSSPTKTHMDSYKIAKEEFSIIQQKVDVLYKVDLKNLEELLKKSGAPYTPGRVTH
ncbi:glycosyl hydrolase [Lutibacter sp.]|uniref:WD40/YVTN/BNR-like repeat-containing protein n=1 Tax=Lutibacter sp. TaxID=1925666 RepID=UPI0027352807|nr:glycosyl hydrolase [Lutibacter sp.]MDP3313378.1 glycosyl hydrolase [Lutibacter sp.]